MTDHKHVHKLPVHTHLPKHTHAHTHTHIFNISSFTLNSDSSLLKRRDTAHVLVFVVLKI